MMSPQGQQMMQMYKALVADPNLIYGAYTPLQVAVLRGQVEVATELIEAGADVHQALTCHENQNHTYLLFVLCSPYACFPLFPF